jgi:hypothetical protein
MSANTSKFTVHEEEFPIRTWISILKSSFHFSIYQGKALGKNQNVLMVIYKALLSSNEDM